MIKKALAIAKAQNLCVVVDSTRLEKGADHNKLMVNVTVSERNNDGIVTRLTQRQHMAVLATDFHVYEFNARVDEAVAATIAYHEGETILFSEPVATNTDAQALAPAPTPQVGETPAAEPKPEIPQLKPETSKRGRGRPKGSTNSAPAATPSEDTTPPTEGVAEAPRIEYYQRGNPEQAKLLGALADEFAPNWKSDAEAKARVHACRDQIIGKPCRVNGEVSEEFRALVRGLLVVGEDLA